MKLMKNVAACRSRVKKLTPFLLLCMMFLATAGYSEVGTAGWPIVKKTQAANARGTTAFTTQYGSLSGMFTNPAIIANRTRAEAFLMSETGLAGDSLGGLVYGHPLRNGMVAGGLVGYDAGTMDLNWIEGGELKTEKVSAQRDLLGIVSYGYRYRDDLYLGGSLKAASSTIAQRSTAYAVAADVGAVYQPKENVTVSASLQNLGMATKFVDKSNPLPTSLYVGGGYTMKIKDYNLLSGLGVTYNFVDQSFSPEIGVEMRYSIISMGVGYRFNRQESNLQLSLGVTWNNVEFSYAYVPGIYLESTHRMNISYRFSAPFAKKRADAPAKSSVTTAATVPTRAPAAMKAPVKPEAKQSLIKSPVVRKKG